jgi:hypothetical protein
MNSNGIISAPVSIDDVKTVLGVASNDLATLCKSSNINMWARFKPINYNWVAPLREEYFELARYGIKKYTSMEFSHGNVELD